MVVVVGGCVCVWGGLGEGVQPVKIISLILSRVNRCGENGISPK